MSRSQKKEKKSSVPESSQNHQQKENSGQASETPGEVPTLVRSQKRELSYVPESSRHDYTPSEIERAARSVRKMMARKRYCSNNSCPDDLQQNIQIDSEWLDKVTETVTDYGSSLHPNEGQPTIYRVHRHNNSDDFPDSEAYRPAVISIGPYHCYYYHYYERASKSMQDHKWRCVNKLIARQHQLDGSNDTRALLGKRKSCFFLFSYHRPTPSLAPPLQRSFNEHNSGLYRRNIGTLILTFSLSQCKDYNHEKCLAAMKALESKVRSCYSEKITDDSNELALMMMLDGCFILCLLLNEDDNCNDFRDLQDSLIEGNLWIWQKVKYDLLLVENQIPLFIIEKLFDLLRTPDDANVNLVSRALRLFSNLDLHRMDAPFSIPTHQVHHLLHLFYLSIVPYELSIEQSTPSSLTPNWIPSAMELQDAGVKFKKKKKNALCFLDINFSKGIMHIPTLEIHDFSIKLFRNLIAFEQCYPDTQCHITNYAVFMDCMINTPMDVRLLHLNGILRDRTGVDHGATVFFRRLCKGIHYASDKNYLSSVYEDVTKYQGSKWHKWRAGLARDYFNNPWAAISVGAAVVLLLLTIVQTFFTVYPYFKPKN